VEQVNFWTGLKLRYYMGVRKYRAMIEKLVETKQRELRRKQKVLEKKAA
jgi:hypothetical protein